MKDISSAAFLGGLMAIVGICTLGALFAENGGIPWRAWDRSEQAGFIGGGFGVVLGILLVLCGCGGSQSQPQPTDPVTVEVIACEPTLGTAGQYYEMSARCREVSICAATMPEVEDRETIREEAESYAEELDLEFDDYLKAGRTGCYNGPVFREATEFLEGARRNGLFCRGP
jgi:hypothetical protein